MLRLGRRTRHKVRRRLQRTGTRRAIRPRICPDWRWAARRSGNESPAGRAPRWPTMAKDRRILPRPQTFETKLACVIGERCGNVHSRAPVSTGDGEEHRRNLTEHGPSLPQMGRAVASGEKTKSGETVTSDEKKGKQIPHRRSPKTGDRVRDDRLKKGPTRSRSLSLFGYECALSCILGLS